MLHVLSLWGQKLKLHGNQPRTTMDVLEASFQRCLSVSGYSLRGSNFLVSFDEETGRVVAHQDIPQGACIGEVFGTPCYIWDVGHAEYMFIDDDMVVDVSKEVPRQVLSLVRDDNQSECPCNCEISVMHSPSEDPPCDIRFFLVAVRAIHAGDELVYDVPYGSYRG